MRYFWKKATEEYSHTSLGSASTHIAVI